MLNSVLVRSVAHAAPKLLDRLFAEPEGFWLWMEAPWRQPVRGGVRRPAPSAVGI
jgi:hypothetical protein